MERKESKPEVENQGAGPAAEELLPLVYTELHRLAVKKLAGEHPGHTLQPTALVHEAWLRLGRSHSSCWENRAHFLGAAAEAMRRILVESARRKHRIKHGEGYIQVNAEDIEAELASPMPDEDLLALDEALTQLAEHDPEAARLVSLRFFVGLTQAQAAEEMGISRSSADRTWVFARAWLYQQIHLPE